MKSLMLFEKPKSELVIGRGILSKIGEIIRVKIGCARICVVTDNNAKMLFGDEILNSLAREGIDASVFSFLPGEQSKCMQTVVDIYDYLAETKLSRSDVIVALGGGVVGDVAGFVASTYLRSVACVQVPTTLLAQIDSSIGGKSGLNIPGGKNLVGTLAQPRLVIIDSDLLLGLPSEEVKNGISEAIKYGCVADCSLFERLGYGKPLEFIEELILACVKIKRDLICEDEQERGSRLALNFGHTLGHAIEAAYGYDKISHGKAIAVGMHMITCVSERRGLTKKGTAKRLFEMFSVYGLPTSASIPTEKLVSWAMVDKKLFDGKLNLVLLNEIGSAFLYPLEPSSLFEFLTCEE